MDKWDRKTNFNCESCRYYVPKKAYGDNQGACRRNAPTLKGYPVVYGNADWCGEHKIGSNPVRDGKEKPDLGGILNLHRDYIEKEAKEIERVNNLHREVIAEEKAKIKSNIIGLIANINSRAQNTLPQTEISYITGKTQIIRGLLEKL